MAVLLRVSRVDEADLLMYVEGCRFTMLVYLLIDHDKTELCVVVNLTKLHPNPLMLQ